MNNDELPFDESTLSSEDLAALRAFDAIENWEIPSSATMMPSVRENSASYGEPDDVLSIFLKEAEEDIASMLETLQKVEQENYTQPSHFAALQRIGHKMHGTAGAMSYPHMAEIASSIEIIAEQVTHSMLQPAVGSRAISSAVDVLESCLYRLVQNGEEPTDTLADLRAIYTQFSIDLDQPIREKASSHPAAIHTSKQPFDILISHSETLLAQHVAIEYAYKQVEIAFQDLQAAQDRFRRAETLFSVSLTQERSSHLPEDFTSSSLITRIFDTAPSRVTARSRRSKVSSASTQSLLQHASTWDELDIEHYTERDMLLHSLREATTNVDICAMRLKQAHHALQKLQQENMTYVTSLRDNALLLRLKPLSTIIPQMREVVTTSMLAKRHEMNFEVTGDEVEIDQELLSSLAPPLIHMLQTSVDTATTATSAAEQPSSSPQSHHIWLHAHNIHNEITLEIGFSMPVGGGTLSTLRDHLRLLHGSISLERNARGGISFFLRFPRVRGLLRCLLVRVADQKLLIPLSQVDHVGHIEQATDDFFYSLRSLLNIPASSTPQISRAGIKQVVFLRLPEVDTQREPLKILVDEIIDETELAVRPLAPHLKRSGVTGSTIDGQGDVLLLLDIAELVYEKKTMEPLRPRMVTRSVKILVAEDSTSFRNSVVQTLSRALYQVSEARDGLEALEALKSDTNTPDILLLDIEMPFLTGYDLLAVLRQDSRFSSMKVVMLTSRTSERHEQHAARLGAHAYLTKPSAPEDLLATIQQLVPRPIHK
ncbi:MAG: response regulator [Ktedonobacteraceae bacterium]|nr:response regulator [Ktedonobacteraceae bacterium]